jgi:hypothetical protein
MTFVPRRWSLSQAGGILALVILFAFCLGYVRNYGVNVPYWDEWELLARFIDVYHGKAHWLDVLGTKHNEHLVGVPFVLMMVQHLVTGFDVKAQLQTGVFLQGLSAVVIVLVGGQGLSPRRWGVWCASVGLVMFSLCQSKNLLWGFQTPWFLITFLLVSSLALLEYAARNETRILWLLGAGGLATLCSFSSLHGVLVWPAGVLLLAAKREFRIRAVLDCPRMRLWLLMAIIVGIGFVAVWLGGGRSSPVSKGDLAVMLYIFVGTFGSLFGDWGPYGVVVAGLLALGVVGAALTKVRASDERNVYGFQIGLIAFGLLFSLLVAVGRSPFGFGAARDTHYTAYALLAMTGSVSILLREVMGRVDTARQQRRGAWAFVALFVVLTAWVGALCDGLVKGGQWRREQSIGAHTLLNIRTTPDFVLARMLFAAPDLVRREGAFLEAHGMAIYRDGDEGLPPDVRGYQKMPASMEAEIRRFPAGREAIERAWSVYLTGADLRAAFEPLDPGFAQVLLDWAYGASSQGDHYLSKELEPYKANYQEIRSSRTNLQE